METARRASSVATAGGGGFAVRLGRALFRGRDLLFPLLFLPLAAAGRPLLPAGRADALLDAAGIALVLAGQLLRAAVMGTTYLRRGGRRREVFADALERGGLFAHCRNPLYLGNVAILAGLALIRNAAPFYLLAFPLFVLIYLLRVIAEEDYLAARFGAAFEDYRRETPRFLPRLRGLGRTLAALEIDWPAAVRGEYSSAHTALQAVLLLLVWEDYQRGGAAGAAPTLLAALAVWLPVALLYVVVLRRKKAGRLGSGYS